MDFATVGVLLVTPVIQSLADALEKTFVVHKLWEQGDEKRYLRENGTGIRAVVSTFAKGVSDDILAQLPAVEMIASYGVGLDRINLETLKRKGVLLTNTPDIQEPVADLAMALLLAVTRRVCQADRYVRAGQWPRETFPFGVGLQGKVCGIVGMGRIGQAIARRADAFGLQVIYNGPRKKAEVSYPYYENLIGLAEKSDFLILALPGGKETCRVVNADVLQALGKSGYLINVARGSVVDEQALIDSLRAGAIAGAALDVFEMEPLATSPLFGMENVVLLPHIASATCEMRTEMGVTVLNNLKAHFSGQSLLTPVLL